jgi:hypothetical protein
MEKREVQIQQVYNDKEKNNETIFKDLYKVKIHSITLRELMVLQSIYVCRTMTDIVNLVKA